MNATAELFAFLLVELGGDREYFLSMFAYDGSDLLFVGSKGLFDAFLLIDRKWHRFLIGYHAPLEKSAKACYGAGHD